MKMLNTNLLMMNSPWPILCTMNLYLSLIMLAMKMNMLIEEMIMALIFMFMVNEWMNNSEKEDMILGMKNNLIKTAMKNMTLLLILSEIMFFSSLFYINLSMNLFNNSMFNLKFFMKIFKLNFNMSFMNLIVLMTSSMTFMISLMWIKEKKIKSLKMLNNTMWMGMYFLMIQLMEYKFMNFNMSNSMFFSNFFMMTMFHMLHVMAGLMMIFHLKLKLMMMNLNLMKMMMLCWYWHFIDLIWMMIFMLIYL